MLSITIPGISADPSKPFRKRDPLCSGDNDGVRFLFDMAFRWCYADGTATATKGVRDVAERADSTLTVVAGNPIPLVSNGLDFSGITVPGTFVGVPASVMADLFAEQLFLICFYMTAPTSADWFIGTRCLFQGSAAPSSYVTSPDIGMIGYGGGSNSIIARRQTSVNNYVALSASPGAINAYGQLTQVAMWRTADEFGLRLKTVDGQNGQTAAAGAKDTADFSTAVGAFGVPKGFWTTAGLTADELDAVKFRLHRGFVENLARSGRDPVDVLDADWARQINRAVFN